MPSGGDVVLVGRGANLLLKLVPGVLRVRTVAPLELRAQRIANAEGLELDKARRLATVVDQQRKGYIARIFGADWASPLNYDLVLNMGRLSLEQAAFTVLDLATDSQYQPSTETEFLLTDMVLAGRVRCELVNALDIHSLEVDCQAGQVSLSGYVGSQEDLNKAHDLVSEVDGIVTVNSNLEVSPSLVKILP